MPAATSATRAAARDRLFIDDLPVEKIRGYARPHTLTIELGGAEGCAAPDLLLLTGWTDYAFSSDNVAAHQAGLAMEPPSLAVLDNDGKWQTVIEEIGIPVGRPQTIAVDLVGQVDVREPRRCASPPACASTGIRFRSPRAIAA